MRLRYTGVIPVTFMDGRVGECLPDEEFTLPDEDATRFLVRADVEEVDAEGDESSADDEDHEADEHEPAVTPEVEAEPVVDDSTTDNS